MTMMDILRRDLTTVQRIEAALTRIVELASMFSLGDDIQPVILTPYSPLRLQLTGVRSRVEMVLDIHNHWRVHFVTPISSSIRRYQLLDTAFIAALCFLRQPYDDVKLAIEILAEEILDDANP